MSVIVTYDHPRDGGSDIVISLNDGSYWTLWGRGKRLHIYEDECELTIDELYRIGKVFDAPMIGP